jgi:uncharacterized OB-fold protein
MPSSTYLPEGLPIPVPGPGGLGAPYFEGLRRERLLLPRCRACGLFQWPPGWICHACHAADLSWTQVEPEGVIFSWARSWHAVHPALKDAVPYLTVIVEIEGAGGVRLVGNLLGDPLQTVRIGARVRGRFEHHAHGAPPYTLLQWTAADAPVIG